MRKFGFLILGLLMVMGVAGLRLADPYPVRAARLFYFDYLQRTWPRAFADLPVRVVDIDEAALAQFGQWPWPRNRIAELVRRLSDDYGAAVVAFDVLFPEPDRLSLSRLLADPRVPPLLSAPPTPEMLSAFDNDRVLAQTMQDRPVVLGMAEGQDGEFAAPYQKAGFVEVGLAPARGLVPLRSTTGVLSMLQEAARGIGGINVGPSDDPGIVRVVPLLWQTGAGPLPALPLEALRVALGETTYRILGASDAEGVVSAVRLGGYTIPTAPDGQFWIHYRREDARLYVPAAAVLAPGIDPALRARLQGTIVLVGTSAAGLLDLRTTPLGQTVPGVSIHAQVLEQILSGDYLTRGDLEAGLEILAFICLSAIVVSVMSMTSPVVSMIAGGVAALAVLTTSGVMFQRGTLFDATFPMAGGFAVFLLLAAYQFIIADRDKRRIRRSFLHYVAPSVLQEIEKSGHNTELGGLIRPVTVLFCDLRNFTPLSERMSPQALVALLNGLFSTFTDCILKENGTIDKFIGDSVMAFWNAPLETPGYHARACHAALALRGALRTFNDSALAPAGTEPLAVGVGLASGPACVGNIGSRQRFSYSAIGDTVNIAARIEASSRHLNYDLVICEETRAEAGGMATLPAGQIALKGKSGRLRLHILVGDASVAGSECFARLQLCHDELLAVLGALGRVPAGKIERCKQLAAEIEPGLAGFYDRIPSRTADFLPPPPDRQRSLEHQV